MQPYGKHWDYARRRPECMLIIDDRYDGNMCDDCFEDMMRIDREADMKSRVAKAMADIGVKPAPNPEGYMIPPEANSTYELTLTSTKDDPQELILWLTKIATSKMFSVIDMPYCIELTQAGLPHIHALLASTKKYLDTSKIKTLGFPYRYELKKVRCIEAYFNYIYKEKDNFLIIEYCRNKKVNQFHNARPQENLPQENLPQAPHGNHEVPL